MAVVGTQYPPHCYCGLVGWAPNTACGRTPCIHALVQDVLWEMSVGGWLSEHVGVGMSMLRYNGVIQHSNNLDTYIVYEWDVVRCGS